MDSLVSAAGGLIGVELFDPVELSGSERSTVLRCRTASGGTVVVKAYGDGPEGRRGFAAEAAGLSLGLAGPRLLGTDRDASLLVMEDLEAALSLADVLLGQDGQAAVEGLLTWARTLGQLATESVRRSDELARVWAQHSESKMTLPTRRWVKACTDALLDTLKEVGINPPPGLVEELDGVGRDLDRFPAFSPGDTCLDNNLLTANGLRLVDFESACFSPVFMTAAYCRMPFPSCWCVFDMPPDLAAEVEGAYREQVVAAYPALADDAVWEAGMRQAVAAWTLDVTSWLLPLTELDEPLHPTRRPVATPRQVLRYRWQAAAELTGLPAFAQTMRLLLRAVADAWDMPPLPAFPAFQTLH